MINQNRMIACITFAIFLLLSSQRSTFGADARYAMVVKQNNYTQTGATTPVSSGSLFAATIGLNPGGSLTSATIAGPNIAGSKSLAPEGTAQRWSYSESFANQALLDASHPNSPVPYTFSITGAADGAHGTSSLGIFTDGFPQVPQILNAAALSSTALANGMTISWNSTKSEWTSLQLIDMSNAQSPVVVFSTPDFGQPGALDFHTSSITVPGGIVSPDARMVLNLGFTRLTAVDSVSYPGVPIFSGYISNTNLEIPVPEPISAACLFPALLALTIKRPSGTTFLTRDGRFLRDEPIDQR
ncbi:MAG TPA: hypothetical protein VHM90_20035 [Phycisphaerae bacterium]|nr:hypothetical protein [Phycisphaerae bacterium]